MASEQVHLGPGQIQHTEQPPMLIMMGQHQRRHMPTLIAVGPASIYINRPTLSQSTADQMWFKISTKIGSNSTVQLSLIQPIIIIIV